MQRISFQPPDPKEPGDLGVNLSEDDARLQTTMKE